MLSLIEQPEDYSQMLKRIFVATLIAGIACTLTLGYFSPLIQSLLFSSSTKLKIGPVDLPWLVVVIPLGLAIVSRAIKLHDRISDLLNIRRRFDVRHILTPLVQGARITIDDHVRTTLKTRRHELMKNTFYKYAPNANDAVINKQYVVAALDRWGWFWCCVEPSIVMLLAAVIAWILVSFQVAILFTLVAVFLVLLAFALWPGCIRAAKTQVDDILDDQSRREEIQDKFNAVFSTRH